MQKTIKREKDKLGGFAMLWLVPIGLWILAPLDWPYGYYQFLRLACTICLFFLIFFESDVFTYWGFWPIAFVGLGLLYNPILPVHLDKETWTMLNIGSAGFLAIHFFYILTVGLPEDRKAKDG